MVFFIYRNKIKFCRIRKRGLRVLLLLVVLVFTLCFLLVYWKHRHVNSLIEGEPPIYVTDLCFVLDKNLLAVILVNSAAINVNRRRLIRATWANKYLCRALKIAVVFLVGRSDDPALVREVNDERNLYGDVLQVDTVDSYRHLVEKIVNGIDWSLKNCPNTKYVTKIDDDVFLNIFEFQRYLEETIVHRQAAYFICLLWPSIDVQRDTLSKWYVSYEEYPHPTYPPYCSGAAYIMPHAVASKVCQLYLTEPIFWIEDVYITGFLAARGNLGHFQAAHFYGFVNYKYDNLIRGNIIFAHINKNETAIKNNLWKNIINYQKLINNTLIVAPETYKVEILPTDSYDYYEVN
ncbi:beta-1,3-galactosyltransferase 5-like [Centruroides vittatus]|uniref:beta-1,3-galactosyltransferase 5-like n=1 Tax=Centruroides vittatus TaxID=120091 RepID=UPI00350FCF31